MADVAELELAEKLAALFAAMLGIFGETWRRKYGTDDDEAGTWGRVLEGLSMRQVEGGIRMVREYWESEWPPTPARFRKWAMDSVRPYDVVPEHRRIAVQRAQPEVEQAGMAELRKIVGGR